MAKKFFTFVDRFLPIEFFEEDPITITLTIGDEMDGKIDKIFSEDLKKPMDAAKKRGLLEDLIGKENTERILSRFEDVDGYAIDQVLLYIRGEYVERKQKNLLAAISGRQRK